MDLRGEHRIPARRERVWALLNDPDVLRACIPGCDSLERSGPDAFTARVTTKVGPVKATFDGAVTLTDLNPPASYRIVGEGKGGVAGFARGAADVRLAEDGQDTILTYAVDAKVGGKLAQLGGRLIESTARKLAGQFFDCFAARAAEGSTVAGVGAPALGAGMASPAVPTGASEGTGRDLHGVASASPSYGGEADGARESHRTDVGAGTGSGYTPVMDTREARLENPLWDDSQRTDAPQGGGILSSLAGTPIVGAAAHTTTGLDEDRMEVEEALHMREPAASAAPRMTAPMGATASTAPELGTPARGDPHRPNPMERAEAELERQAAGGALGGPVVWGLLVLAALIAIYFLAR